jgi:predicted nucleic-acid-binding Zn-ribbon protein
MIAILGVFILFMLALTIPYGAYAYYAEPLGIPFWCWFWGHDLDAGHEAYYCNRCGMSDYYEPWIIWDTPGLYIIPTVRAWWQVLTNRFRVYGSLWVRCPSCGKLEYVLGFEVGDHDICFPF